MSMLLMGCGGAAGSGGIAKPDLTGWDFFWSMEEGTGTVVDESGVAGSDVDLDFTTVAGGGACTWATDEAMGGTVINFPSNYSSVAARLKRDDFNETSSTKITCVALIKPDTLGGASQYPCLFGKNDYVTGTNQNGWALYFNYNNNGTYFYYTDGGANSDGFLVTHATCGYVAGNVYCIMASLDLGSDLAKLYVNGVEKGAGDSSIPFGTIGGTNVGSGIHFSLGHSGDPAAATNAAYSFDGKMAWAAIDGSYYDPTAAAAFYAALGL